MHYVGRQGWIILEGIRIRLDYTASRDRKQWIYVYIRRSRGGAGIQLYRQYIGIACGLKGRQGKIGILASRARGVLEQ